MDLVFILCFFKKKNLCNSLTVVSSFLVLELFKNNNVSMKSSLNYIILLLYI